MAAGDVVISGAYKASDTAGIDQFLTGKLLTSGGHVFVLPDANSGQLWIGYIEGRGT